MFRQLDVKLFYFIAYHSQIDDQFERINQIVKIALRFAMIMLNNSIDWSDLMFRIQRIFNNIIVSIDKTFNEIFYDFTLFHSKNLLSKFFVDVILIFSSIVFRSIQRVIRNEIIDVIAFAQMHAKYYYDKSHISVFMKIDDWAFFQLYKNYKISITIRLNKKYAQQYIDSFQIIERIERFVYRLVLSVNWRIYSVFIIAQLEFCSSFGDDFYRRFKSAKSDSVFVENDTNQIKFWKLNRFVNKRKSHRKIEYLVRWKDWNSQHDVWRSLFEFGNVMNLINDYEIDLIDKIFQSMIRNFELRKFFVVFDGKFFTIISLTSAFFVSQFSFDQRFVVVISRKSITTLTSLTSDIEAFTLTRKSVAIFFSSTGQIARRSNRLTRRS